MNRWAGFYTYNGTGSQVFTTTPAQLTQWDYAGRHRIDNLHESGVDALLSDDKIHIKKPGAYYFQAQFSFTGTAGARFTFELYRNGQAVGMAATQTLPNPATPISVSLTMGYLGHENDTFEIYVYSDQAGGATLQLIHGQFGAFSG